MYGKVVMIYVPQGYGLRSSFWKNYLRKKSNSHLMKATLRKYGEL